MDRKLDGVYIHAPMVFKTGALTWCLRSKMLCGYVNLPFFRPRAKSSVFFPCMSPKKDYFMSCLLDHIVHLEDLQDNSC